MNRPEKASVIEIFLVEDHADFRKSLQLMLNDESAFHCISFSKAEDAMQAFDGHTPDVVIMDINLPGMSGIECTRWVKLHYPSTQIMMFTVYEDDAKIFDALQAGASGYLLKRATIEEIQQAILDLHSGGSPMTPNIARRVVASFSSSLSAAKDYSLSTREIQILDLLAQGRRIKEIPDELFISINTVRTHIRNIYEKLQVQSKIEAINKAGKSNYRK